MLKVVVSGNCHGELLKDLLQSSAKFRTAADITYVPNYEKAKCGFGLAPVANLIPELQDCDALIYHDVRDYDFPRLLRRLPASSLAIKIPYITSRIYWPTHDLTPFWLIPYAGSAYIPFPCRVLNGLVERCPDDATIRRVYMQSDLSAAVDMRALWTEQMNYLERTQQGTIFNFVDFTQRNFRNQRLFHLINHPAFAYFTMMTERILQMLNLDDRVAEQQDPFGIQQMPVHPSIIAYYGLTWCDANTRIRLYDKYCDFEEYVDMYIHAYRARLLAA